METRHRAWPHRYCHTTAFLHVALRLGAAATQVLARGGFLHVCTPPVLMTAFLHEALRLKAAATQVPAVNVPHASDSATLHWPYGPQNLVRHTGRLETRQESTLTELARPAPYRNEEPTDTPAVP